MAEKHNQSCLQRRNCPERGADRGVSESAADRAAAIEAQLQVDLRPDAALYVKQVVHWLYTACLQLEAQAKAEIPSGLEPAGLVRRSAAKRQSAATVAAAQNCEPCRRPRGGGSVYRLEAGLEMCLVLGASSLQEQEIDNSIPASLADEMSSSMPSISKCTCLQEASWQP